MVVYIIYEMISFSHKGNRFLHLKVPTYMMQFFLNCES